MSVKEKSTSTVETIDLYGHRQRLKERFLKGGLQAFQDYEVLELLLTYVIPRKDVKGLAKRLLREFGSLADVLDTPREILQEIPGVGQNVALFISLIPQVVARYEQNKKAIKERISGIQDVVNYMMPRVDGPYESFWGVALNSQNEILAAELIQKGSVNRVSVIPRLVVEMAIKHRATGMVLAHNHPSGNTYPSQADVHITKTLCSIFQYLDIVLVDHVILSRSNYFSFAEQGMLGK